MNSLSWLIYLADASDSIGTTVGIVTVASLVGAPLFGGVAVLGRHDSANPVTTATLFRLARWLFVAFIVARLVAVVIPNKETVYAIAASEVGEAALNTATGNKAVRALNAWLDRQIAGDTAAVDAK